jgi:hypothetical protein
VPTLGAMPGGHNIVLDILPGASQCRVPKRQLILPDIPGSASDIKQA